MVRRVVRRVRAPVVRRWSFGLVGLSLVGVAISMVVRGDAAGADFEAYWVATRTWLSGGDPYELPQDVLPYVYAPWGLPLFLPWAVLPWDVAFGAWRGLTLAALLATLTWAVRRRPLSTAIVFGALAVPIGINLDTGNITLPLALAIFGSRFVSRRWAGVTWGAATALKWATLPIGIVLGPVARRWGLATLGTGIAASLVLWPMTADQLRTIASLERPLPVDYLVLTWAVVPWLWTDPDRRRWLHVSRWTAGVRRSLPRWLGGRRHVSGGAARNRGSLA